MEAWRTGALLLLSLLCLLSFCRAAPLTCDQLLTNQNLDTDLSGRWYYHAMSTDSCVLSNLINNLLKPSLAKDFSWNKTTKAYDANATMKVLSFCTTGSETFFEEKTNSYQILPSCADCLVIKDNTTMKFIALLSRKMTIEVADLKQFETQATCLSLPQPQLFNTDYDYRICSDMDNKEPSKEEVKIMVKRTQDFMTGLGTCTVQYFWNWVTSYTG